MLADLLVANNNLYMSSFNCCMVEVSFCEFQPSVFWYWFLVGLIPSFCKLKIKNTENESSTNKSKVLCWTWNTNEEIITSKLNAHIISISVIFAYIYHLSHLKSSFEYN